MRTLGFISTVITEFLRVEGLPHGLPHEGDEDKQTD